MSVINSPWIPFVVALAASVGASRVAQAGDDEDNVIKKVDFTDEGQSTTIHIRGSDTPTFTVYKLERPNRVVVDVSGAELGAAVEKAQENGATIAVGSWAVSQVAAYELDDGGKLVRVVVTLAHPGRYDVEAKGNELVVTVVARDPAPEKVDAEALAAAKEAAEQAKKDSESAKTAKAKAEGDAAKAKEQADAAKAEAKKAKQALADAEAKSSKADKASKADKKRAAEELAAAKAEAERAAKALAAAQKDADKTKQAVEAAKAEAERTREAADLAKAQVETMAAELEAVKAEAKAAKDAAKAAKNDAKAAKDAEQAAKNDAKAAKDAETAAKNDAKAAKDDAKAAKDAEQAAKDAAKAAKADAKKHARDADDARSDADAARSDADRAKAEAAREKQEAAAAKAEADQLKKEAAAAKAEAELQKKEAAAAKAEAAQQKKEAAAAKAEAAAMKKATAEAEAEAERLATEAETARDDAKRARSDADVAQKDAKKKKAAADAAEKEARAQREAAELARAEAAEHERDAQAMRKEAEAMRDEARVRLADAEAEAKAAKQTQADAVAAQKQAEAREAKAREAEDTAAAERKAAKEALAAAEKAKKKGDADADEKVKEAEARLAKAEKARVKAEEKRIAAEQAAETARDEAARRKAETADAIAARTAAEDDKQAAEDAATEAKASAKRAEELRVAEVEAANKAAEAKIAAEDAERSKASKKDIEAKRAEAAKLEKLAKKATKKREAEEAELASIVEQRRQAEAELDQVKVARAEAEDATKKAKQAKADAEAEAAQAKKDAEAARKEAAIAKQDAEAAKKDAEAAKARKRTAEADAEEAPPPAKKKETKKKAKQEPAKAVAVKNVEFEQAGDDAQVTISMGGKVEAEVVQADEHAAELLLTGADLPDKLQRKLDVRKFDGAVRAISTFRDPDDATKVRVVVELTGEASPRLERVGEDLVWHFEGAGAVAQATPKKKTKKHKTQDIPAPVVGGYGATSTPVTSTSVAQSSGGKKRVYHGPAIDLDFKDADIHNLLRFLANIGRVSIVVPDDIKATVTVRLKKVPWDQALEVILESKGLWYRKTGSLYRIDSRTVLDEEDQKEAERIRAAIQAEAPEAEVFTLNYASAKDTAAKLEPLLSPKGRIEVDSRTNSLIVNDIKAHRRRVIDLAARLDIQTPQVMIEARIVEARSTYAREIGIQWGGSANASQAGGNATGLLFPNSIGVAGGADDRVTPGAGVATPTDFAVNLPATVGTGLGGALGVSLGSVGGNFNLNLRLSAAEDQGTVRIVSQPKITVLNNTEAEISQGVSIPISVVSAQGTQTQFVPADLALTVTPYVSQRDCSIAMDVKVTKNEPDFVNTGARGDPTILRKEAHTKILVADGETTVMGGITTRNTGLAYNKVPFFGDLPVIGWFFKKRSENDDRTELLIFITPTITNRGFLTCE